jgi:phage minor structural protein
LYTIDHTKKPQKISLFLAKPDLNRTTVGKINAAFNISHTINFGQINQLSFSIPYEIMINSQPARNPIVDLIREKFLIKVVFGTSEEWYIINKKSKSMNDYDSISVECYSLAYELKYKKIIDYKVDSYNCFQVLTDCLEDTNWSVGYINPEFSTKYRQFDVSSKTKLDFIDEICETFKGVAMYDTVNKTVSIWKEEEISTYKGFWISYGKYLETIEETVSIEDIVTRLIVTPNDKASIVSTNPTGQNYIDDFSYFLYPFERDENRNVVYSSYFMSDELCHAILDYNELINQNANTFSIYLTTRKTLETDLTTLNNTMTTLQDDLKVILDNIEVAKKNNESTANLIKQRDAKKTSISNQQKLINLKQAEIDSNETQIDNLNELLKIENNITGNLFTELTYYIQEQEWSDENQIDDNDYFYAASDYLSTVSVPPINLTMSIVNFFDIVEEQHNWNRLNIGDIIRVKHPKLNIDVKTKITSIVFNYDEGTIELTISNTKRPDTVQQKLQNAFYKIDKLSTDYNKRKQNWELVATNFNTRNDRIKVKPTSPSITSQTITHKANDNGSVDLTLNWSYNDYTRSKKDADNIDGFMIFLYSSTNAEDYSFGSNVAQETPFTVSYEKRTYTIPSVPSNVYYTIGIKAYRNVDDDIAKDGVLFSDIVAYPQYNPSPTLSIKGNVSGKVNGVTYTVSDVAPEYPDDKDKWFDTTTKQDKIYNEATSTWEVSVADTSAVTVSFNGTYTGDGTLSKEIPIGFQPKTVKVYTTSSSDASLLISSINGGYKFSGLTLIGNEDSTPNPSFGKLSTNGFIVGTDSSLFGNVNGVLYYYEAFK